MPSPSRPLRGAGVIAIRLVAKVKPRLLSWSPDVGTDLIVAVGQHRAGRSEFRPGYDFVEITADLSWGRHPRKE
jgi:hypothetical protein